jgi:hypothetical protein
MPSNLIKLSLLSLLLKEKYVRHNSRTWAWPREWGMWAWWSQPWGAWPGGAWWSRRRGARPWGTWAWWNYCRSTWPRPWGPTTITRASTGGRSRGRTRACASVATKPLATKPSTRSPRGDYLHLPWASWRLLGARGAALTYGRRHMPPLQGTPLAGRASFGYGGEPYF